MNNIWFLSRERNLMICGFNRIVKEDGHTELWVKEVDGGSRKIATGQEAIKLEQALLDIIWGGYPSIITDGNGNFSTNINIQSNQEELEEVE